MLFRKTNEKRNRSLQKCTITSYAISRDLEKVSRIDKKTDQHTNCSNCSHFILFSVALFSYLLSTEIKSQIQFRTLIIVIAVVVHFVRKKQKREKKYMLLVCFDYEKNS